MKSGSVFSQKSETFISPENFQLGHFANRGARKTRVHDCTKLRRHCVPTEI